MFVYRFVHITLRHEQNKYRNEYVHVYIYIYIHTYIERAPPNGTGQDLCKRLGGGIRRHCHCGAVCFSKELHCIFTAKPLLGDVWVNYAGFLK